MSANDNTIMEFDESSWQYSTQSNTSLTKHYHAKFSAKFEFPSLKELTFDFAPIINGSPLQLTDTKYRVFKDLHKESKNLGVPARFYLHKKKPAGEVHMRLFILVHPVAAQILVPIIGACQALDALFQTYYINANDDVFISLDELEPLEYITSKKAIHAWRRILIHHIDREKTERREQLYSDMSRIGFGPEGDTASVYTLAAYFLDLLEQEDISPSISDFLPYWCVERLRDRMDILSKIETKLKTPYNPALEESMPMLLPDENGSQGLRQRRVYPQEGIPLPPMGDRRHNQFRPDNNNVLTRYESPLQMAQNENHQEVLKIDDRPARTSWAVNEVMEKVSRAASEKTCVLLMTLLCSITAAAIASLAAFRQTPSGTIYDSGFFFAAAQCILSLGSSYLTIVPILRSRAIRRGYTFWWRLTLGIGAMAAIISCPVYTASSEWSGLLGLVSGLAQIAATLQLVECFQASEAGLVS
ncbi:MAG: hypothetical protein Q9157_005714 [Trypethelium eluteriae]